MEPVEGCEPEAACKKQKIANTDTRNEQTLVTNKRSFGKFVLYRVRPDGTGLVSKIGNGTGCFF